MEFLDSLWAWIGTALGGVTLAGIISTIIYGCLKGGFNKAIQKIDVEHIAERATEKGVERIKRISFKQSIQPIVESELKKVTEQANRYIDSALKEMQTKLDNVVNILDKLACYFDNSIGVSDEKKAELREAIEEAKQEINNEQEVKVVDEKKKKDDEVIDEVSTTMTYVPTAVTR